MTTLRWSYTRYERAHFAGKSLIRRFNRWEAYAASYDGLDVILLVEHVRRKVTVCIYTGPAERAADVEVLLSLSLPARSGSRSGGGGNESGDYVFARLAAPDVLRGH
jgi:hypothetical protein